MKLSHTHHLLIQCSFIQASVFTASKTLKVMAFKGGGSVRGLALAAFGKALSDTPY